MAPPEKTRAARLSDPRCLAATNDISQVHGGRASRLPRILTLDELLAETPSAPTLPTALEVVAECLSALGIPAEIHPSCAYMTCELGEALNVIAQAGRRAQS